MFEARARQPAKFRWLTSSRAVVETPQRWVAWIALVVAVALAAVGFWTHHAVQESLHDIQSENLRTLLEADIAALTIWLENEKQTVDALAGDRDISRLSVQLPGIAAGSSEPRTKLVAFRELSALCKTLGPFIDTEDHPGFGVVDRAGLILAANEDAYVGLSVAPEGLPWLNRVIQGETLVTHPCFQRGLVDGEFVNLDTPYMAAGARHSCPPAGVWFPGRGSRRRPRSQGHQALEHHPV